MATLKGFTRTPRSESLTGGIMVDTWRGALRVRKWPKKSGTPTSAKQLYWIDWFRQANLLAKYVDAATARRAIELTAGTGLYPRDIILSAMRGRLYSWVDQNGKKWRSMAAIQDISDSLDILTQDIGSILVRATDRWRDITPGNAGEVLTHGAPGSVPDWQPAAGGGGYLGGAMAALSSAQTISTASWTAIEWNQEIYDTAGIHDPVTNNTRFTVPTGFNKVELGSNFSWEGGSGGYRICTWYKNGSGIAGVPRVTVTPTTSYGPAMNLRSLPIVCVPGDYFECMVIQNSGSDKDVLAQDSSWAGITLITEV